MLEVTWFFLAALPLVAYTVLDGFDLGVGILHHRVARTDAERKAADVAIARLRDAGALFRVDPAAGCKLERVELRSGALSLGGAATSTDGHDDLDATFEFACTQAQKAGFAEIGLFAALPRLQRVDVQAVTRKGQMKATLKRPTTRLSLAR